MKTPISLIIDDATPGIQVYHYHINPPFTHDGRFIKEFVPNELLFRFCDTVERYGIGGKFSVVPYPAARGFIGRDIMGVSAADRLEWLDTVKKRLSPYFGFCAEIMTHYYTVDLKSGELLPEDEEAWSFHATEQELTDYISRALELDLEAGIRCTGITSPWSFGKLNERNYVLGIVNAFERVMGSNRSWYFLQGFDKGVNIRPWVEYNDGRRILVNVPYTVADYFWQGIEKPDNSPEWISTIADFYITEDGKGGRIVEALDNGCYPIMCTHWQSMFANGYYTGVMALDEVARRIEANLSDRVEWVSYDRQMEIAIEDNVQRPECCPYLG